MDVTSAALLTPREVDRLLRYPRGRAARLARAHKLPAVFLPDGEIRFDAHELAQALKRFGQKGGERHE